MKKLNNPVDPEMQAFEEALLRSLDQVKAGQHGMVHTPEMIEARRRGRPTGSVKVVTKQPTTLRLDPQTLESWRATGKGWQTRAAEVLETYAKQHMHA
jgi:uncharacterized protein (DUF4415 family)